MRAAAAQVLLAGLDLELLQRLVDRRGRQVRVEVAALAVVDGAVGEDEQLGAVADRLHRLLLEPLDRALRGLRLEQRDVDRRGAAAERLPEVLEQVGLVLAGDPRGRSLSESGARSWWPPRIIGKAVSIVPRVVAGGRRATGGAPKTARVEKCSISRSRSIAGLVTTATVSLK